MAALSPSASSATGVSHGLLDPANYPTPAEASGCPAAKGPRGKKGGDKIDQAATRALASTASPSSGRATSPISLRADEAATRKLHDIGTLVIKALNQGPDSQEAALRKIAETYCGINLQPEPTESDFDKLKKDALKALDNTLREHTNNLSQLTKLAAGKHEQHAAVVQYLVVNEHFDELVHFLQKGKDEKLSAEKLAELEDQVFSTLNGLPEKVMMRGLEKILPMYTSRTYLAVQGFEEASRPDLGGQETTDSKLFRMIQVQNKARARHKQAVQSLQALDTVLKKRNQADVPLTTYAALGAQTGASPDYFATKGAAYQEETKRLQEERAELLKSVKIAEEQMRKYEEQLLNYIETVKNGSKIAPVAFSDPNFTARFFSSRLNDSLGEINAFLTKKRADISLTRVEYYTDPNPELLDDEALKHLLRKINSELDQLIKIMRKFRADNELPYAIKKNEGKDDTIEQENQQKLGNLNCKINYFIEMGNFLALQFLPENQRMLQSKADLKKMQQQKPLTPQEISRFQARTAWDSGLIATKDNQTAAHLAHLSAFVAKHEASCLQAQEFFNEIEVQRDYMLSMYNYGGLCPRNFGPYGKLTKTNTQIPEGVKYKERIKVPTSL
ncbi:MAG: hypothetical protein KDK62_03405 [Chlamydiia bacterium]|nr:hypothetical protein [Chlamydiia bacterium]